MCLCCRHASASVPRGGAVDGRPQPAPQSPHQQCASERCASLHQVEQPHLRPLGLHPDCLPLPPGPPALVAPLSCAAAAAAAGVAALAETSHRPAHEAGIQLPAWTM